MTRVTRVTNFVGLFPLQDYFCEVLAQRELRYGSGAQTLPGALTLDMVGNTDSAIPVFPLLFLVIDASSITTLDAAGMTVIQMLVQEHRSRSPSVEMIFAGAKGPLRRALRKAGAFLALNAMWHWSRIVVAIYICCDFSAFVTYATSIHLYL